MKATRNILLAALVLFTTVACITQRQVQEIVATSNAAMVDVPDLPQADGTVDAKKLDAAVARIESIIASHPNQTVLVNTLRVRQAMLLTVHGKLEAAKIVWSKTSKPTTERDMALYDLRDELVWWFAAAKNFTDGDIQTGNDALTKFATTCEGLTQNSDIRRYLETMRASIGLQIATTTSTVNNDPTARKAKKNAVAADMAAALGRLAKQFDEDDAAWITANWTSSQEFQDVPVAVVRARVELRKLLKAYFKLAKRKKLDEFDPVPWQPDWVKERADAWAAANP